MSENINIDSIIASQSASISDAPDNFTQEEIERSVAEGKVSTLEAEAAKQDIESKAQDMRERVKSPTESFS